MDTGPRFRSPTTAAVRDKTWSGKRKGPVEVSRRRRPPVYSGSTPEIERRGWAQRRSQRDRMEQHFPACAIGFRTTGATWFHMPSTSAWLKYLRRERDSNPRYPYKYTRFRSARL